MDSADLKVSVKTPPLTVIIPMAGLSSRFSSAGYLRPKYELLAHNQTLFYWSMLSLHSLQSHEVRYIFICLKDFNARNFVSEQCRVLNITEFYIVELDSPTKGQAATVYHAIKDIAIVGRILIYNIDTYICGQTLKFQWLDDRISGCVPCVEEPVGTHWSFLKKDDQGFATHITEKIKISDLASIGLYYFSSSRDYVSAYQEFYSGHNTSTSEKESCSDRHQTNKDQADPEHHRLKGEQYVAPLYRLLIEKGQKVFVEIIPIESFIPLGTPAEYEAFKASIITM